jgi:hypothetical protein
MTHDRCLNIEIALLVPRASSKLLNHEHPPVALVIILHVPARQPLHVEENSFDGVANLARNKLTVLNTEAM